MNRESIQLTAKIIAQDTQALYDVAKARGIQMPHPALGIFKSVLAAIEVPNGNGVRLGEKATDAAVSTLIGTQINRNHLRTDNILGHTIDASINSDKQIEITCVFFKDIYPDEWDEAQQLFKKNELTMSFELSADIESQDKLADGTKRLNDYYFTGAGLLFGVKPAYKKARVFEIATKKLQEKLNMERQSLIFANNQNSQKSILEVLNLMADEVKKIEEVQAAEITVGTPVVEPTKAEEVVKAEEPVVMHVKAEEVVATTEVKVEETPVYAESEKEFEEAAKWSTKFINSLPDSSFAVIEPAYKEGKTTDKNARHLPYKDASGKIDLPHYRNALARANQIKPVTDSISEAELRKEAMAELNKHKDVLKAEEVEAKSITTCPNCMNVVEIPKTQHANYVCAKCGTKHAKNTILAGETTDEASMPPEVVKLMKQYIKDGMKNAEALKKAWADYKKKNKASEEVVAQPDMMPVDIQPQDVQQVDNQPSTTVRDEVEKVTVVTDPVAQTQTVTEEKTTKITEDDQVVVEKTEKDVTVYTMAQVDEIKAGYEKQISELKEQIVAKDKEVETLKAAKKEEIVVAEEKPILATGHKKVDAAKEDVDDGNALVNILRHKKANRKN